MPESNRSKSKSAGSAPPKAVSKTATNARGKKTPFRTSTAAPAAAPADKRRKPKAAEPVRHPADPGRSKAELAERRDARAFIRNRAAEKRGPEPTQKLHKLLAQTGMGSRRDMEQVIAAGRVTVNNEVATIGTRVGPSDLVRLDRRMVKLSFEEATLPRILVYHKPEGEIVSRDDPQGRPTVFDKLPSAKAARWIAIGRLDYNTSGLLIFTTSGELANLMMHPRFEVEREYAVRVMGELAEEDRQRLVEGIELDDGMANFHSIRYEGGEAANHWYNVVLKEGRNREVRRMFAVVGVMVSRLMRIRFGIVNMPPRLKRGQWLELEEPQVKMITDWVSKRLAGDEPEAAAPKGRQRGAGYASADDFPDDAPPRARKTPGAKTTGATTAAAKTPRSTAKKPSARSKDIAEQSQAGPARRRRTRSA
jgi:23S rRNA pseudouridine2605 synthase